MTKKKSKKETKKTAAKLVETMPAPSEDTAKSPDTAHSRLPADLKSAVTAFVNSQKMKSFPRIQGAFEQFVRNSDVEAADLMANAKSPIEPLSVSEYFDLLDNFEIFVKKIK